MYLLVSSGIVRVKRPGGGGIVTCTFTNQPVLCLTTSALHSKELFFSLKFPLDSGHHTSGAFKFPSSACMYSVNIVPNMVFFITADESQATAEEYELFNTMRESVPVEVDSSNWRIVKCYGIPRNHAWQQVHELAQLVPMLPAVVDTLPGDQEDPCVCCVERKPVRTLLPCGHKVMCQECTMKLFGSFLIGPDGAAVAKKCPVCNCIVGVVC